MSRTVMVVNSRVWCRGRGGRWIRRWPWASKTAGKGKPRFRMPQSSGLAKRGCKAEGNGYGFRTMKIRTIVVLLVGAAVAPAEEAVNGPGLPFAWPFLEPAEMTYRGGTTRGSEVTLDTGSGDGWKSLQAPDLSNKERDRRAILALAGAYRVSFQFVETAGFREDYTPPRPYFSWGTEEIRILEDSGDFISLQHTLVMFFEGEDGKVQGPMVMKHWRQDWRFEDGTLHTYRGQRTWAREERGAGAVAGAWTQAVFQVDDSPRYEVVGRWSHVGGVSTWESEECWRPLPRREFSVRDDYNVLAGRHRLTITPTGWVHAQDNRKLRLGKGGTVACVGMETGINRYERITSPDLRSAADDYWDRAGGYWEEVRRAWSGVMRKHERFRIKASDGDRKLHQVHFAFAARLGGDGAPKPKAVRRHARQTIERFLVGDGG